MSQLQKLYVRPVLLKLSCVADRQLRAPELRGICN